MLVCGDAQPNACLNIGRKEDICYATQNRQDAVKELVAECDVLLVVGSPNSSNSNRLRELADKSNIPGYLIDDADDLKQEWFEMAQTVGLSAGASAPELLVQGVVKKLEEWGGISPKEKEGAVETITFSLPKLLREIK